MKRPITRYCVACGLALPASGHCRRFECQQAEAERQMKIQSQVWNDLNPEVKDEASEATAERVVVSSDEFEV